MPEIVVQTPNTQPERQRSVITTPRTTDLPGQIFGRWQVLDQYEKTKKGEKKWLCRCECGTERYVLERSLKSGGSLSCGCLRKDELYSAKAYELTGLVFGDLTVLRRAENQRKYGGVWWLCQCSCGSLHEVRATYLVTGKQTNCGSNVHTKKYAYADITNQKFSRLTALYPTKGRDDKGSVMWHCKCDCGNEIDVSYNGLMYSSIKSCGCRKKEHDQKLREFLTHIDKTSLEHIKSTKVPSNSTTGARGVYLIKGKYVAKVNFQKKAYYLGAYKTMEEAVAARKDAEETLFQSTILFYTKWQERAEEDPSWAEENPVQIFVTKSGDSLRVSFLPVLDE